MNHSSSFRFRINSDYLAAAAVTLAPLFYFYRAVLGYRVISPDDGIIFNIPLRVGAANIMRAGYLPLWNPYIFSGMPLHGAAQAGILFPLNWSYLLFSAPVATNVMMLATYMMAALGAYFYARRSGSMVTGAIVTSLAWQWSSFLITHIGHTNILQTAAMLPWILWAVDGYGRRDKTDKQRSPGILLAVLVAVQCFTGHQQTFAYSLMVAAAYAIVMAHHSPERKKRYYRSLVFIVAGVLLAAVQIVPTFELLRNSPRAAADYEYFTSFSMSPRFILTLLAPYLMGGGDGGLLFRVPYIGPTFYAEYAAYVGVISVMLALVALLVCPDKRTKFWAIVAAVGLILALGRFAPLGLYKLISLVPILNLFRVPARHVMEVDFALAVLAGRGVSALASYRTELWARRRVMLVGVAVVGLTLLAVTVGRPPNFALGRKAPASFLRAPELFIPVVFSLLAAWAIWRFARGGRGATFLLLSVLVLDLAVWGQTSGWRAKSAPNNFELWSEPEPVRFLRDRASEKPGEPYRILTQDQPFDPDLPLMPRRGDEWVATLQPDVYMLYGIENAAGYDGFGFTRYQRLAGEMKSWGELGEAERTLRGSGRELDLLNVRYLLTRPGSVEANGESSAAFPASQTPAKFPQAGPLTFPDATVLLGGQLFAAEELKLPSLAAGARLSFTVPPVETDTIALVTNLSFSLELPDSTTVAHIVLYADDGRKFDFDLRVGEHTSEWAYDREDIRRQIKNRRAPVATSYVVKDNRSTFNGHTYVGTLKLPEKARITGGELTMAKLDSAPDLTLSVFHISLANQNQSFPLRAAWITREGSVSEPAQRAETLSGGRWRRLKEFKRVSIFENANALPRAWLASEALTLNENQILAVVRSGALPNGSTWNPQQSALVETQLALPRKANTPDPGEIAKAEVTKHEPNGLEIHTASAAPSVLVLSENYFPGWRVNVDGQPAQLLRVNYNLRGVALPAGEHVVSFQYRPWSVLIGAIVSLLTLTGLLLAPKARNLKTWGQRRK